MKPRTKPAARRVRNFDFDRQLRAYPRSCRTAVKHVALWHPALRDLAISFPALLFVCAVQHQGIDRTQLVARACAGDSLSDLASFARLPVWTRKLPPQACTEAMGCMPGSPFAARHIVNLLPKKDQNWPHWLSFVTCAAQWGDEAFALWIARTFEDIPKRLKEPGLLRFALWAWFSSKPGTLADRLILRRWSQSMSWKSAAEAVDCWFDSLELYLVLERNTVHYTKLTDGTSMGLSS